MGHALLRGAILRKDYSRIGKIIDIPNLIDIQKKSYQQFLQVGVKSEGRTDIGLQGVFKSIFPIKDYSGTATLDFVGYALEEPKYTVEECQQRGMTYASPMKMTVRLVVWDKDRATGAQTIRDVKEQEIYFGEVPLMTENGTFIINGTERVIVSQLHRSPGVFFEYEKGKGYTGGKLHYTARIIPYRGSWLDFEFDQKDWIYVRIDKRRKMFATILLKALGYSIEELLNYFYPAEEITLEGKKLFKKVEPDYLVGQKASKEIRDPKTDEVIIKKDRKFNRAIVKRLVAAGIKHIPIELEDILGRIVAKDIVDKKTGEVLLECNQLVTKEKLDEIEKRGIDKFRVLFIDSSGPFFRETLINDRITNEETKIIQAYRKENPEDTTSNMTINAMVEIYKRLKPGDPPTVAAAKQNFQNLFFAADRYDLSKVGRLKLNRKLGFDVALETTTLRNEDIYGVVRYLVGLKNGQGIVDDIDHLGNRRVRSVGELLENQYRIGLLRMERAVKERMSLGELETLMPHDFVNPKPVQAVIREFFGSSQLSQFMDQTNPLSEITHKRRLSALGPGGLTRERAGFEVRDVHATHYGRICPIETPEGPNIGLIVSLSTYARVNEFGFIETPYREVVSGKVTNRIKYLSALDEEEHVIAQANAPIDKDGKFTTEFVSARKGGEFVMARPEEITLMDVSPNQLVSIASALVPFLENDDANRALMGSNMQRQAVPLIQSDAPLVGTGIEEVVAKDSGVTVVAKRDGAVESVDASRIVIKSHDGVDIYNLTKFKRSNQNTCMNQKPIVKIGERVSKGDIIADGPSTDCGELALGRNVIVAFMPWGGYNFEDSILLSERLMKDDVFTSVHIEEFETMARDMKLGKEDITRDIPNVGEEALKDLDEGGIVRIGAEVGPGDILVGKVTPKGETQLSPEEKLLRAIFGEKAEDVKDTSLKVPPGIEGVVIDVNVFARKGADRDERSKSIEDKEIAKLAKDRDDEIKIVKDSAFKKMKKLLVGKRLAAKLADKKGNVILKKGTTITEDILDKLPMGRWEEMSIEDEHSEKELKRVVDNFNEQVDLIKVVFGERIDRLKRGDELPPGVIKMVKVYIAMKRKVAVGDKMAGRHGNKGVVSRILPEEDLPYLSDGTPVDLVLNPLGVPSRMNVGQILETHLGWAAMNLGKELAQYMEREYSPNALREKIKKLYGSLDFSKFINDLSDKEVVEIAKRLKKGILIASPVFDGAREQDIKDMLEKAELPLNGKVTLYDGRTGVPFDQNVTVGVMYMLKLHHLVDDKIHARSTGPYSLVTQQPLGGKAQFGGQRLGEMEVWALEAYGAAHTLQEFLTVKSDDVPGRTRVYEAIVKKDYHMEPTLPESFNVLIKELQSLALDVELLEEEK
ncbi:MAG: DNA-directed RNA polymerase subunit beta [Deltaproteobacteria bacterium GWC2_42_51]|nr:MAG: DNA-directed RNA polymerase subunit beta [Deltaproteobacteria bacterium GWA2_42_85]OGP30815.1 MAG: DNA-directed RNA polymerase subunit beta [Deltaproteobacteria bacterium GWB2_42_7]OGP32088.1 MAG: DNA-directed RNA polymerase subunit beta [Deltaproteobacteria bacterium GWC2_42_51]OGP47933.1 MAG: DNA-directed RNA polymerase subunit beta [Deltaproteobacteria bacterium GWF2_42_12]OGQ24558.1 MAG: DNA-directed RNA polymerase subunit beta [Deltaproteobacteria bacterium RIFCSPHIGHO2_02_FULL_42_